MRKRKLGDRYGMHDEEYGPGPELPDPWKRISKFEYTDVVPIGRLVGETFIGFAIEDVDVVDGHSRSSHCVITLFGEATNNFTMAFDHGWCSSTYLVRLTGMKNVGRPIAAAWVGSGEGLDCGHRGNMRHTSIDVAFDDGDRASLTMVSEWDHCFEEKPFVTDPVSDKPNATSDRIWRI
jgi:hypothetical protein